MLHTGASHFSSRRALRSGLSVVLTTTTVFSAIIASQPASVASAAPIRTGHQSPVSAQATSTSAAQAAYGKLPTSFVANAGQTDPSVRFSASGSGGSLFFTPGGVTLSLPLTYETSQADLNPGAPPDSHRAQTPTVKTAVAIKLTFAGANPNATIEGTDQLPGKANYFIGNDKTKWATDVKTYGGVAYRNLYPGIDLSYTGQSGVLKGTYTVAPGADPSQIGWQYKGADSATVDGQGNLAIKASTASLTEQVPAVWQVRADGSHTAITAHYQVDSQGIAHFAIGAYDHTQVLIVDPGLVYSTYLGGSGSDYANGIAVNSAGQAYITGVTNSTSFPISTGTYQISNGGGVDAFVTELNTGGTAIVYSTYIGGSADDVARAIAVDSSGTYAYITGYTFSTNFPTTSGAFQTALNGSSFNAFVTALNPGGNSLYYSSYLGGTGGDEGFAIAVDSSGFPYVAGYAGSTNFPTTSGAFQTAFKPSIYTVNSDGFVTKFSNPGAGLAYSTYLGFSGSNGDYGIALDSTNDAYVTGYTSGPYYWFSGAAVAPYPVAYQTVYGGGPFDGFMTELNPTGSSINYSTYLGGAGDDFGTAIALDISGYVYITGQTTGGFPVTSGAFQTSVSNSNPHGFVTALHPPAIGNNSLYYSTYLGGNQYDKPAAIAVDRFFDAHVTGSTSSTDFPTTSGAFQSSLPGTVNAFATVVNNIGTNLVLSTYLGGSNYDGGYGVATDFEGDTYVAGYTNSTNFPLMVPIQGSFQGGANDVFVTKLDTLVGRIDSIGIYRGGVFYLRLHNSQGYADLTVTFNPSGNNAPIVGDWTGTGFDTIGVFDRTMAHFTLCNQNNTTNCAIGSNQISFSLGNGNDTPLSGHWEIAASHDGAGVYRPSNGVLYLKDTLTTGFADYAMVMGLPGDQGIAGDWRGKGFDSPGIYRPSSIAFYLSNQVTNGSVYADITATYGSSTDLPIVGDWIAQSHDGIGMFRPSNGYVYLRNTTDTGFANNAFFYGTAGDQPIAGHWQIIAYPPAPPIAHPAGPPTIFVPKTPAPSNGGAGSVIVPDDNQIGG